MEAPCQQKKEKKLSGHFWEINHLSEKLTTDDDRRRPTDESALEKFRCHSAGGAKNFSEQRNDVTQIVNIWRLACKTPIPKLLFLIKSSKKIFKIWQSYSPSYSYSLSVCQI